MDKKLKEMILCVTVFGLCLVSCSQAAEPIAAATMTPVPTETPTITPTPTEEGLSEEELTALNHVAEYYADYVPSLVANKEAVYQEMATARALLAGETVDKSDWNQSKYENVHMAIWLIQEQSRGMQPLQFESNGETFYYDKDKNIDNPWSSDPEKKEQATIPAYIPMYRDADNFIHFYWEGEWQIAPRSNEVDFGNFITKDNVNDFLDPTKTADSFSRQLDMFDVSFVPMIILDDTTADLEKHPMYRQGMTYLDVRIDVLLPNADNYLYGLNGKMMSMDSQFVLFPDRENAWSFVNTLGDMHQDFDGAFSQNQTVYVGLDEHQESLNSDINTKEYVENMSITDDVVDGSIWQDIQHSSELSIYMWDAMSFSRVRSDGQWIEIP